MTSCGNTSANRVCRWMRRLRTTSASTSELHQLLAHLDHDLEYYGLPAADFTAANRVVRWHTTKRAYA
jgi:hypothetical protein